MANLCLLCLFVFCALVSSLPHSIPQTGLPCEELDVSPCIRTERIEQRNVASKSGSVWANDLRQGKDAASQKRPTGGPATARLHSHKGEIHHHSDEDRARAHPFFCGDGACGRAPALDHRHGPAPARPGPAENSTASPSPPPLRGDFQYASDEERGYRAPANRLFCGDGACGRALPAEHRRPEIQHRVDPSHPKSRRRGFDEGGQVAPEWIKTLLAGLENTGEGRGPSVLEKRHQGHEHSDADDGEEPSSGVGEEREVKEQEEGKVERQEQGEADGGQEGDQELEGGRGGQDEDDREEEEEDDDDGHEEDDHDGAEHEVDGEQEHAGEKEGHDTERQKPERGKEEQPQDHEHPKEQDDEQGDGQDDETVDDGRERESPMTTWIASGKGACGHDYTSTSRGACLSPSQMHLCGHSLTAWSPSRTSPVVARVVDVCDGLEDFGGEGVWFTEDVFRELGGGDEGVIREKVRWKMGSEEAAETSDEGRDAPPSPTESPDQAPSPGPSDDTPHGASPHDADHEKPSSPDDSSDPEHSGPAPDEPTQGPEDAGTDEGLGGGGEETEEGGQEES